MHRRWRTKRFDGRRWVDYRYFDDDYKAIRQHLKNMEKEYSTLRIQLRPGGQFIPPGGIDSLLWIQHDAVSFGEPREYWEDILKRAKEELSR